MTCKIIHNFPEPRLEREWRSFLTRADFPTHYISPEYFEEPSLQNQKPFVVAAFEQGQIVGVLSGIRTEEGLKCGLRSRPQIAFDAQADARVVSNRLLDGLMQEAVGSKLISVQTWRPMESWQRRGFKVASQEAAVMLDLTGGPDAVFKQFAGTRRTDIRKAIKLGVEVSEATTPEDFRSFYELHCDWSSRMHFAQTPPDVFEKMFLLRNSRRLFLARHEGRVIAGAVVRFCPGAIVEYAANSSYQDALYLKPNQILQWRIIEWACREGFKRYSFGSTHPFMLKFGGEILPSYRYRLDRTMFRRHDLKDEAVRIARKVFNRLPAQVRRQLRQRKQE